MNFTNISNAIKAIDGVKNKPDYTNLRIAHGKDRCANPPRSGPQGASGARRSASGGHVADGNGEGDHLDVEGEMLDGTDAVLLGAGGGDEDEGQLVVEPVAVGSETAQEMHVDDAAEPKAAAIATAAA